MDAGWLTPQQVYVKDDNLLINNEFNNHAKSISYPLIIALNIGYPIFKLITTKIGIASGVAGVVVTRCGKSSVSPVKKPKTFYARIPVGC